MEHHETKYDSITEKFTRVLEIVYSKCITHLLLIIFMNQPMREARVEQQGEDIFMYRWRGSGDRWCSETISNCHFIEWSSDLEG